MSPDAPDASPRAATFSFNRFIVKKALFEQVERASIPEGETKPATIHTSTTLTLSIQTNRERPEGQVTLSAVISPDPKWQPYRIEIAICGVFASQDASPQLFDEFCKTAVPSILFPYVRQIAQTLTADAEFGRVRLNPVNIQNLLATHWPKVDQPSEASVPNEP